jgi:putative transposase
LWTQSYFVETVGGANEQVVRDYVKNQLDEMDRTENKNFSFFSF